MRLHIPLFVCEGQVLGLNGDAKIFGVLRSLAYFSTDVVVQLGDQFFGVFLGFNFSVTHDHVNAQAVIDHTVVVRCSRVHGSHAIGQFFFFFRPHQVHIAMGGAQINGLRRVPSEIQKGTAFLKRLDRIGGQILKVVNFTLVIDRVLRPGLLEDLDNLFGAPVAVFVGGRFSGEVG